MCWYIWSRDLLEVIVEPLRACSPGGTRLPRAQAVYICQFFTGCVFKLLSRYTTPARSLHVPRARKGVAGACGHRLRLSLKLSCGPSDLLYRYSGRYVRTSSLRNVCQYNTDSASSLFYTPPPVHVRSVYLVDHLGCSIASMIV